MKNPNGYGSVRKLHGKRRRPYQVSVTTGWEIVDGKSKQIQKTVGYYATKNDALIALADYNKTPYDLDLKNITFEEVYEKYVLPDVEKMKTSSKKSYGIAYKHTQGIQHLKIAEIRKAHLQAVIDKMAGMSTSSQTNTIHIIRKVFRAAMENDIIMKDYSSFIAINSSREKYSKRIFTEDEIKKLWECAKTDSTAEDIILLIYTGVRIGELMEITCGNIHLDERYIEVHGTKTKASDRIVPMHKDIIYIIEKKMKGKNDNEYLIEVSDKYTDARSNIFSRTQFKPLCAALNLTHTPHECRHTFISFAYKCELPPLTIKRIVGHTASNITENVYTHTFISDLIKGIDLLKFS